MSEISRPFVYIASLPRTGSTLLSEALTKLPYAFIFHEPHLGKNYFARQANDIARLKEIGCDVERFANWRLLLAFWLRRLRPFGYRQDFMVHQFKKNLLPKLYVEQVGVKEIKNRGWENYLRHFPNMKVVITGRDPRDIYISMFKKYQRKTMAWSGPFSPETVAAELNAEFAIQQAISQKADSIWVRYEDFCQDPASLEKIKGFVQSPIPEQGEIGAFLSTQPYRTHEHALHGGQITQQRIHRWKSEKDTSLLDDAHRLCALMTNYQHFWEYE